MEGEEAESLCPLTSIREKWPIFEGSFNHSSSNKGKDSAKEEGGGRPRRTSRGEREIIQSEEKKRKYFCRALDTEELKCGKPLQKPRPLIGFTTS